VVMVIFLRGLCTLLDGDEKFECLFLLLYELRCYDFMFKL
jgi:hypothetical protein